MQVFLVFLTLATTVFGGVMPPMVNKDLKPVAEEWHRSAEEYDDFEQYDSNNHDFEGYPKTIHVHEDHKHYDHHHYEDSHEHHPPTIVNYHEQPKTVHIHEKHVVKEPQLVHVHEHHHHHHHHVKTLPISIIRKTVYIKHG